MKILISKEIHPIAKESLENAGHTVRVLKSGDSLIEKAKEADALITMLSDKVDKDFLDSNRHLKVITNYAVGHNNIDSVYAKELGIAIGNTPDVLTNATAELAMALLFSVSKHILAASKNVEENNWLNWEPLGFLGTELTGKKLGLIGAGRIGSRFAEICHHGLNMEIEYFSRSKKEYLEKNLKAKKVSLEHLLKESDIVSLHCPLNEQTHHLLDKTSFEMMKNSAILINTARGEVINEVDLAKALKDNEILAAGLDVTEIEPLPKSSPLRQLNNCLITPHIGSATTKARKDMALICVQNILNGLEKKKLKGCVNKVYL